MKLQDVEGSGQNSENKYKADDCLDGGIKLTRLLSQKLL